MPRRATKAPATEYFTTFQVARFLHVSPPTVVNWINSKLLTAHRTPGGHRRIAKADIVVFARQNDYPIPDFGSSGPVQLPLPARVEPTLRRVLIVDDMPDFCMVLRDFLELLGGYQIEVALSGFAAGRIVERFKPELILLDFNLDPNNQGQMDGFQLLDMLRDDPVTRRIPVLGCTGRVTARVEALVSAGGLVGCLQKPFPLAELADAVRGVFEGGALAPLAAPVRARA